MLLEGLDVRKATEGQECSAEMEELLRTAPQASSRVLSPEERRKGLGELGRLPQELLEDTLEILVEEGSQSLANAARVSRALNVLVLPRLYRDIELDASLDSFKAQTEAIDRLVLLRQLPEAVAVLVLDTQAEMLPLLSRVLAQLGPFVVRLDVRASSLDSLPAFSSMPRLTDIEVIMSGCLRGRDGAGRDVLDRLLQPATCSVQACRISHENEDKNDDDNDNDGEGVDIGKLLVTQPALIEFRATQDSYPNTQKLGFVPNNTGPSSSCALRCLVFGRGIFMDATELTDLLLCAPNLVELTVGELDPPMDYERLPLLPHLRSLAGFGLELVQVGKAVAHPGQLDTFVLGAEADDETLAKANDIATLGSRKLALLFGGCDDETIVWEIVADAAAGTELTQLRVVVSPEWEINALTLPTTLVTIAAALAPVASSLEVLTYLDSHPTDSAPVEPEDVQALFKAIPALRSFSIAAGADDPNHFGPDCQKRDVNIQDFKTWFGPPISDLLRFNLDTLVERAV